MASNQRARRGKRSQEAEDLVQYERETYAYKAGDEPMLQKPVHQVKCIMRIHERDLEGISRLIWGLYTTNLVFIAALFLLFTLNRYFN